MIIYIPTYGRISSQLTFSNLPRSFRDRTFFVCTEKESAYLRNTGNVLVQPDPNMGISEKRKWIVEQCPEERMVMLDDDLRFCVRREDDNGKFRPATDEDTVYAFAELEAILDEETPHAGFAARGGSIGDAARRGGWQQAKRQMYVLGYHVPTVLQHAEMGRLSTHEDMDVTLQLLLKGFPNMINFTFLVDQKFGNPGGCTNERTIEKSNADCILLEKFHAPFVKVTKKEYKASIPRLEVTCQWQKALEHGLLKRQ